jgi:hypothetical protein
MPTRAPTAPTGISVSPYSQVTVARHPHSAYLPFYRSHAHNRAIDFADKTPFYRANNTPDPVTHPR